MKLYLNKYYNKINVLRDFEIKTYNTFYYGPKCHMTLICKASLRACGLYKCIKETRCQLKRLTTIAARCISK